ncbi:hypothetical protein LSM04_003417 [Trypanosoma melophagium]|uniref:uncharacterized protein n=1 Tax=Trypanosoma melophagium TaxID=715481 RepID=UPI00351A8ADD|nr:hypothetical protein LSM04_003417 [Trypanosoma melophagium]
MKRTLNPNAGEFRPTNSGENTRNGTTTNTTTTNSNTHSNTNTNMPQSYSNNSTESQYFLSVTRCLVELRAAFFRHSGSINLMRHVEFERLLRRCFFAAHDSNELSVASSSVCDRCKPFWLSYSLAYMQMAREVVQEIELGNNSQTKVMETTTRTRRGGVTTITSTGNNGNMNSSYTVGEDKREAEMDIGMVGSLVGQEMLLGREELRELYLNTVRPLIPSLLRRELANCAKRGNTICSTNVKDAMMYALDVFFLFTRIQFLPFLDNSAGTSYSACVQYISRLRERLLRPDVAEPFLNLVLVLMLLSSVHQASRPCSMETNIITTTTTTTTSTTTPTNDNNINSSSKNSNENNLNNSGESRICHKVQWLLCRYFPALVVAFLAGSPLQSVEELRHSFTANNIDGCFPEMRSCSRGITAIRELFSYNSKTAILWNKTLAEVITFAMRHLDQTNRSSVGTDNTNSIFLLTKYTALDDYMHVNCPTILNCLLNSTDNVAEQSHLSPYHQQHQYQYQQKQYGVRSLRSAEFHRMAMEAASGSTGGEYDTVYFSLMALVNMECFTAADLSRLFSTLSDAYSCSCNNCSSFYCCCCDAFNAFLASPVCATLRPSALELLDVLHALTPANGHQNSGNSNQQSGNNNSGSNGHNGEERKREHLQALREVEEMLLLLPQS